MADTAGHIDLERNIASIVVGVRHRQDLGDLDPLMNSIEEIGLLQPVTITPDGILICGRRRLEAVRRLGWRTLKVWVRTGLSDDLSMLLAQQHENSTHMQLGPLEAAALYREVKALKAEDAARRQAATRFGTRDPDRQKDGPGDSPEPSNWTGDAREEAARLVTNSASYHRLEQVSAIESIADDETQPMKMRQLAQAELKNIRGGAPVNPSYLRVQEAAQMLGQNAEPNEPASAEELEQLATEALRRAKEEQARRTAGRRAKRVKATPPGRRSIRAFNLTWSDLDGWSSHFDAEDIGANLDDSDWETFERVLRETTAFAKAVRAARSRACDPMSA